MKRVIVIGAGMGGLAAALSLSGKGIPVTLIEKHSSAGGKIRQVDVAGKLIDAGPTVFTMRWVFDKLFADAGLKLDEHVTLKQSSLLARHSWVGSEPLDLYSDIEHSAQAIAAFAGEQEARAYRSFAKKAEAVFDTLNGPFMQSPRPNPVSLSLSQGLSGMVSMANTQPFTSLWKALSQSFKDPRLVQLFARYATYCGSSPMQAPATLMLIAHVERAGVWVLKGGMHALAEATLQAAKSRGCECLFGQGVERILTDKHSVTGVLLDSGERLDATDIIFNGDSQALSLGLLGKPAANALKSRPAHSLSAITRCEVAQSHGFELAHHNVFFGHDYPREFDAIFKQQTICEDPTIYVCAQDRFDGRPNMQQQADNLGCERLFSLMNAPARNLSTDELQQSNTTMTQRLLAHGLALNEHQGVTHVDTPNSFATLFPATDGALYGRPTHGWMGSFNRPGSATARQGLYLAGGSVHPGAGVPMVTLSGQLAAERLLADRARK